MTAGELLALKTQELLGKQYRIFTEDAFNDDFTTATTGVFGNPQVGLGKQAFSEYKGIIVGVVKLYKPTRSNVDFYSLSADYDMDFWVPVNFVKRDVNGKLLEPPKFNFYGDMERLIDSIVNKKITFLDGKYGHISMSEPMSTGTKEETASGSRKVMKVSGRVSITDKGIFGGDIKYYLEINNEWHELEDVNSNNTQAIFDGSAIIAQGDIKPDNFTAQQNYNISIHFDNYKTDNLAINKIKRIAKLNALDSGAVKISKKKKLHVKIDYGDGNIYEFWAIPTITFRTTRNEIGGFIVNLLNDNDED